MKRESLASLRKCMYPYPVYHATLDDGRAVRFTVWQRADAPAKGFDWEACRRTILNTTDARSPFNRFFAEGYQHYDIYDARYSQLQQSTLAETGRKIIAAHLEQAGEVLADDPLSATMHPAAKRKSAASTASNDPVLKELRAAMKAALKEIDAGSIIPAHLAFRRVKVALTPWNLAGAD